MNRIVSTLEHCERFHKGNTISKIWPRNSAPNLAKRNKGVCPQKDLYKNGHSNFHHHSLKLGTVNQLWKTHSRMLLNNIRYKNKLLVYNNTGGSKKTSMEQNKPGIKSTSCMIPYRMKFKSRKKELMRLGIRGAIGSWGVGSGRGTGWKGECVGCRKYFFWSWYWSYAFSNI